MEDRTQTTGDIIPLSDALDAPLVDRRPQPIVPGENVRGEIVTDADFKLKRLAKTITSQERRLVDSILKIGEALSEAQDILSDSNGGTFNRWVKESCRISTTTAYRYLGAYRAFGSYDVTLQRKIEASAMYALTTNNVPSGAREEAIGLAESGERITGSIAKGIVRKYAGSTQGKDRPAPITIETPTAFIVVRPKVEGLEIDTILEAAKSQYKFENRKARLKAA